MLLSAEAQSYTSHFRTKLPWARPRALRGEEDLFACASTEPETIFSRPLHTSAFSPFSQRVEPGEIIGSAEQTVQNSHLESQDRRQRQCGCGRCVTHLTSRRPQSHKAKQLLCMCVQPRSPVRCAQLSPNTQFCVLTLKKEKLAFKWDSCLAGVKWVGWKFFVWSNLSRYHFTGEGH